MLHKEYIEGWNERTFISARKGMYACKAKSLLLELRSKNAPYFGETVVSLSYISASIQAVFHDSPDLPSITITLLVVLVVGIILSLC
jgi:hypothetical protein